MAGRMRPREGSGAALDWRNRQLSHSAHAQAAAVSMARQKYDEDDLQPDAPRSPWRRRVLVWALALVGLGLGFLVPYTLYLNSLLGEQFASLTWQEPTRVYARPLVLAPGLALDGRTLGYELQAAGYREGDGVAPGTWRAQEDGGRWLVSSRGFRDIDGAVAPAR